MRALMFFFLCLISQLVMAADALTIYGSSVAWDDLSARSALLESAKLPVWDASLIEKANEAYRHPEEHQLIKNKDTKRYSTLFLDAYWGPVANPFVTSSRPAKVFVFTSSEGAADFYMLPVVKSAVDGHAYVMSDASRPRLLEEWVSDIKSRQSQPVSIKFNVCHGYGNLPGDTCMGKSYQTEEFYALGDDRAERGIMAMDAMRNKSVSAHRDDKKDWHQYTVTRAALNGYSGSSGSILSRSVQWNDLALRKKVLGTATEWASARVIQDNFYKIRDLRYFNDKQKDGFLRRISWLYPDDGCWTRASAVVNHLFGTVKNEVNAYARPSKVFAFGNLCANTPNHRSGKVTWWYHTAPLVNDALTKQAYVLDPSINPQKPLPMEEWVSAISANTGACHGEGRHAVEKINVCTGYGASPSDTCVGMGSGFASEAQNALMQDAYQDYERSRQLELGRDADKVLGDEAPWR